MPNIKISELPNATVAALTDFEPIVQGLTTKKLEFSVRKDQLLNVPEYIKSWNAMTNTPTLVSGIGATDTMYVVNHAGTTNLDGISTWNVGDYAYFNGFSWTKVHNSIEISPTNLVYVDPTNGNDSGADGTIVYPFKTVGAANTSITTASASNPFCIFIMPGTVSEATIQKKPYVSYVGSSLGSVIFTSAGGFVLSVGHASSTPHLSFVSNIILDGCDINFVGLTYLGSAWSMCLDNIHTSNSKISITGRIGQQYYIQGANWATSTVGKEVDIDGCTIDLYSGHFFSLKYKVSPTAAIGILNLYGGNIPTVALDTANIASVNVNNCSITSALSVTGSITLNIDADSVPPSGVNVISGAPTINYRTKADFINADFTPSNYTPTNTRVKGHLEGIDNALAGGGGTTIYTGNSSLTSNRTVTLSSRSLSFVEGAENVRIRDLISHPSAIFALNSTSRGFLQPRMTSGERTGIVSPAEGLQVYDTDVEANFIFSNGEWKGIRSYTAPQLSELLQFTANSFIRSGSTAVNSSLFGTQQFGPSGTDSIYASFTLPGETANFGLQLEFYWSPSSTNVGNVVWQLAIAYTIPGNVITTNYLLSPTQLVVATTGTADFLIKSIMPVAAFDVTANPDAMFNLIVRRLGSDGSDTFTGQAQFSKLNLRYLISL